QCRSERATPQVATDAEKGDRYRTPIALDRASACDTAPVTGYRNNAFQPTEGRKREVYLRALLGRIVKGREPVRAMASRPRRARTGARHGVYDRKGSRSCPPWCLVQ